MSRTFATWAWTPRASASGSPSCWRALSLGIDLGFGQPMEHVLRQCRIALRIAELVGLDEETRSSIYYSALLVNVGCHSDAHEQALLVRRRHRAEGDASTTPSPSAAADVLAMLRMLGSGEHSPAPAAGRSRLRAVGSQGARRDDRRARRDGAVAGRGARARRRRARRPGQRATNAGTAEGSPTVSLAATRYPLPRASRSSPSSSRWPTGPTASTAALAPGRAAGPGPQFDPALVEVVGRDAEKVFHELDELDSWDAVIDGEPALTRTLLGRRSATRPWPRSAGSST